MESIRTHNKYDRYLSPLDVWAIAFGCTIGWSAFLMPGSTFLPVAGPMGSLISIAISVVIMSVIGASFSYLMRNRPGTGGVYAYTKDAFGRDHAFLCGWFLSLSYITILLMNATSLFLIIRLVFGERLQIGYASYNIAGNEIYLGEVGASVVALAIVGLLFINAKPFLQRLQTILAVVLLAGVVIIGAVCLPRLNLESLKGAFGIQGSSPAFSVFTIVMLSPGAFVGFEVISLETAHFNFKIRRSRWIIILSILMCGLLYLCLTLVGISAVPDGYTSWQTYIADLSHQEGITELPTFYSATAIMGNSGLIILAVAAIAAILTSMIAGYRATLRVLSTMAEDRILTEKFSSTTNSILFIMVVSILISIFGRNLLESFKELISFGAIIGFGYTSASAWRLARKEGKRLYVWTGAFGTILSVTFAVVQLIPKLAAVEIMGSDAFLMLMIWCLLGFLFYLRTVARSSTADQSSTSATSVVIFALMLYSILIWLGKRLMAAKNLKAVHDMIQMDGSLMLLIIFTGLGIMMYIQRLIRRKHETLEQERNATAQDAEEEKEKSAGPESLPSTPASEQDVSDSTLEQ